LVPEGQLARSVSPARQVTVPLVVPASTASSPSPLTVVQALPSAAANRATLAMLFLPTDTENLHLSHTDKNSPNSGPRTYCSRPVDPQNG
jgi:hypothetical protein